MAKNPIKSWDVADKAMARMGELNQEIANTTQVKEAVIKALAKELEEETAPLKAEYADLEAKVKAFANDHEADFGGFRSKELLNGIVRLRKVTNIEYLEGEAQTLSLLQQQGYQHCYKTKTTITKSALQALSPDALRAVGAAKVESKSVSIELKYA